MLLFIITRFMYQEKPVLEKERVAYAIHDISSYGKGAFVPVNCGAIPEGIVESELFGHVKGAFSGAVRERKGRFELGP